MVKKWLIIAVLALLMAGGVILFYAKMVDLTLLIVILLGSSILIGLNFSEINQVKKKEVDKLIRTAEELYNDNQLNNALKTFRKARRISPDSYEAMLGTAQCLRMLLEYDKALEEYKKAAELDPQRHEAHFFLGMTLLQSNRFDEALSSFKTVESIKDDLEDLSYLLGEIYEKTGDYRKAFDSYRKYLETCVECKMRLGIISKMESLQRKLCPEAQSAENIEEAPEPDPIVKPEPQRVIIGSSSRIETPAPLETDESSSYYEDSEPSESLPGVIYKTAGQEKKPEKAPAGPKAAARLLGISKKRTPVMLNLEVQIGSSKDREKYVKPAILEGNGEPDRKVMLNLSPEALGINLKGKAEEVKAPEALNGAGCSGAEKKEIRRPSISI